MAVEMLEKSDLPDHVTIKATDSAKNLFL